MQINSIMKKVKDFIETPKGREKIKEARIDAFTNGKKFGTGEGITSANDYTRIANKYLDTLNTTVSNDIRSSDSLKEIIGELKNTSTVFKPARVGKSQIGVEIEFNKASLTRESLNLESGKKIDNIIALFNNGMDAREETPWGDWEHGGRWHHVKGWSHRDALKFMQSASRNFKDEYTEQYNLKRIELDEEYKK